MKTFISFVIGMFVGATAPTIFVHATYWVIIVVAITGRAFLTFKGCP